MAEIDRLRNTRIFNTPLESGLRALILLCAADKQYYDLQNLVYFDYLLTHSGDIEKGPKSLHADIPHRLSAIAMRRQLSFSGLDLMVSRDLVEKKFDPVKGVTYAATDLAIKFLSYFSTAYYKDLLIRANWVITEFGNSSADDLKKIFNSNFDRWNSEFTKEDFQRFNK
mgnify:CR=1 FL=1